MDTQPVPRSPKKLIDSLRWVLILGLLNGLLYTFLIPPWQHYDEPGHFEYAWLIANQPGLPAAGSYDQSMRRETAASMIEHGFFRDLNFRPDLISNSPVWIGVPQISDFPLYYILAAAPLWLFRGSDIALQLYFGRLVSLSLYLVTLFSVYYICKEITSPGSRLLWMVPLSILLLPGFTDLMTAINDDVGATAFFSLFLWAGVLIIRRGLSWQRVGAFMVTAILCLLTKTTVAIAAGMMVIIFPLVLLFSHARNRFRWSLLSVVLLSLVVLFRWGDAASWTRMSYQQEVDRSLQANAPSGKHVFQLKAQSSLLQIIPAQDLQRLRGKTVTIGAWIWASTEARARNVTLLINKQPYFQEVDLARNPIFIVEKLVIPVDAQQLQVLLDPNSPTKDDATFYYDSLVLVEGDFTRRGTPELLNMSGSEILWDGQQLRNALRNASAEQAGPGIRPTIDRLVSSYVPGLPSNLLGYLLDWRSTAWYYRSALGYILQTFWGKFGWGHVELIGAQSYLILLIITLLGILGGLASLISRWRHHATDAIVFLGLAMLIIFTLALLRGLSSITFQLFIPSARYTFPAIIPVTLMLNTGWLWIAEKLGQRRYPGIFTWLYLGFFICLDAVSIASIIHYYY